MSKTNWYVTASDGYTTLVEEFTTMHYALKATKHALKKGFVVTLEKKHDSTT